MDDHAREKQSGAGDYGGAEPGDEALGGDGSEGSPG